VVPQGLAVFFPVVLGGDFRSPLLVFFLACFRDLSLGDLMGEICGTIHGSLGCDSPPKSVSKGADFGVFRVLGLEVFLAGFLRFPLFGQVLVGLNLAMDSSLGSYYPQSLVQVRGAIREIELWIWGS
jgi:hypothetical protein